MNRLIRNLCVIFSLTVGASPLWAGGSPRVELDPAWEAAYTRAREIELSRTEKLTPPQTRTVILQEISERYSLRIKPLLPPDLSHLSATFAGVALQAREGARKLGMPVENIRVRWVVDDGAALRVSRTSGITINLKRVSLDFNGSKTTPSSLSQGYWRLYIADSYNVSNVSKAPLYVPEDSRWSRARYIRNEEFMMGQGLQSIGAGSIALRTAETNAQGRSAARLFTQWIQRASSSLKGFGQGWQKGCSDVPAHIAWSNARLSQLNRDVKRVQSVLKTLKPRAALTSVKASLGVLGTVAFIAADVALNGRSQVPQRSVPDGPRTSAADTRYRRS